MIRMTFCLRRRHGLTLKEFHDYWRETHAPLVQKYSAALHIKRYQQIHTFEESDLAPFLTSRNSLTPYDGVAELWFDSIEVVLSNKDDPEARKAGKALLEDEKRFIDLENSPIFFGNEHLVVDECW